MGVGGRVDSNLVGCPEKRFSGDDVHIKKRTMMCLFRAVNVSL